MNLLLQKPQKAIKQFISPAYFEEETLSPVFFRYLLMHSNNLKGWFTLFDQISFPAYVDISTAYSNKEYAWIPWWEQFKTATQGHKVFLKSNREHCKKFKTVFCKDKSRF